MSSLAPESEALIRVSVDVRGDVATVWHAWTDPAIVAQWWGGWAAGAAPEMVFEARIGGQWRFAMDFDGQVQWVGGHITQLERPGLLGLTFAWEGADAPATPLKVALSAGKPGYTKVELVHDQSLGGNACADGWNWSLACLRAFLEG